MSFLPSNSSKTCTLLFMFYRKEKHKIGRRVHDERELKFTWRALEGSEGSEQIWDIENSAPNKCVSGSFLMTSTEQQNFQNCREFTQTVNNINRWRLGICKDNWVIFWAFKVEQGLFSAVKTCDLMKKILNKIKKKSRASSFNQLFLNTLSLSINRLVESKKLSL